MINNPIIFFLNTNGVFLLIVLVIAYLWFIEKNVGEALHALFATVFGGATALILKELFNFPRPYFTDGSPPMAGYFNYGGFPSLHTTLAFALATTVALHQRRFGIFLLVIAGIIGVGRVVANVHYPLDIVGGAVLGTTISFLVEKLHFPKERGKR